MAEDGTTSDRAAARAMLDSFASVGATHFDVTWINSAGDPRRPRTLRKALQSLGGKMPEPKNDDWLESVHIEGISVADLSRTMPAVLDTANADRLNLIVRPSGPAVRFIQLDDLTADKLPRLAPAMFLIIETSPGSFQAWLAMPGEHARNLRAASAKARARISVQAEPRASPAAGI